MAKKFDVIVIGGGHAGVEAASVCARIGLRCALVTFSASSIGRMSCNPSIGGVAKGRTAREVDVLGGVMAKAADESALCYQILNRKKGPAVWATRCQTNRAKYEACVQHYIAQQSLIDVVEGECKQIVFESSSLGKRVVGILLTDGTEVLAEKIIVCTGTFASGKIFVGFDEEKQGRLGENAANYISQALKDCGHTLFRFKTGTPPRLQRDSIDFSRLQVQKGEENYVPFALSTKKLLPIEKQSNCYIAYTNLHTHEIIRENLQFSALYGGKICGIGPRYCPSVEVKVVRFPHHERHVIFLEPDGAQEDEIYPGGLSNSFPPEIQQGIVRSIEGLEDARIVQNAYAVEYDVVDAREVNMQLESAKVHGLYFAGQILGTSGYEEAAALGTFAGLNAALSLIGEAPIKLARQCAYAAVMIDDLVNRGADEPYRLLSARAEFRLLLREDNAWHTVPKMMTPEIFAKVSPEYAPRIDLWRQSLDAAQKVLVNRGISTHEAEFLGVTAGELMRDYLARPDADWEKVAAIEARFAELQPTVAATFRAESKYGGYVDRQVRAAENMETLYAMVIPDGFDYSNLNLRIEAREKFVRFAPKTLGEAAAISGIAASELAVLAAALKCRTF